MCLIDVVNVSKSFRSSLDEGKEVKAVDGLSLQIHEGELVTIFGPNGCGKTTFLGLLAGVLHADSGAIRWNLKEGDALQVGYVFQNYGDTLLPWRTVEGNLAFPLEVRRLDAQEIKKRVGKRLEMFRLSEHAEKYIYELSGGLKQLVAIARATVYDPQLLLLDEPFSALDYSLSRLMWRQFREFWSDLNVTTVFVSHNVDEALFLGDKVCVLTPRPTRLAAEIPIPFGPTRSLDLLKDETFFAVRAKVLSAFENGRPE